MQRGGWGLGLRGPLLPGTCGPWMLSRPPPCELSAPLRGSASLARTAARHGSTLLEASPGCMPLFLLIYCKLDKTNKKKVTMLPQL